MDLFVYSGFCFIGRMHRYTPNYGPSSSQKRGPVGQTRTAVCLDNRTLEMVGIRILLDFRPLGKNPKGESMGSRTPGKKRGQLGVDIRSLEKTIITTLLN